MKAPKNRKPMTDEQKAFMAEEEAKKAKELAQYHAVSTIKMVALQVKSGAQTQEYLDECIAEYEAAYYPAKFYA